MTREQRSDLMKLSNLISFKIKIKDDWPQLLFSLGMMAIVTGLLIWMFVGNGKVYVMDVLQWLESQGPKAMLWVVALQALFVVSMIPGPFFTLAAGYLFGLGLGITVAMCGTIMGSVIAYWLGRFLVKSSNTKIFAKHPKLLASAEWVKRGGGFFVMATRLVPIFPFKISNWVFGAIRVPFPQFLWGTAVGILFPILISVTAGTLSSDLMHLFKPQEGHSKEQIIISGSAIVFAIIAYYIAIRRAKILLKQNKE